MPQVTYYRFLMFVAKSQKINHAIGKPQYDHLIIILKKKKDKT